jgi:hypothetical protein
VGTSAWTNWRAFSAEDSELENFDDELQSDVMFVGGAPRFGPFQLRTVIRQSGQVGPALIVHGGIHANLVPDPVVDGSLTPSNSDAYHGGTITEELAALISLILGVRLRWAGTLRVSGIHIHRESGEPYLFEVPRLARPGAPNREMLPQVVRRTASLSDLSLLASFPDIDEESQVALVRAARAYASAIWWANEDPNQSWLGLVTALEVAAKSRQTLATDPLELLQEIWPQAHAAVAPATEEVQADVASLLAPQIRAARTFVDFVEQCAPPPPPSRPEWDKLDWDSMRKHARVIYDHRSKSLHAGKPFPMPMLEEPRLSETGAVQEVPFGLNTSAAGAIWHAKEYPMLLATFEYIARGALLNWWNELARLK